LSETAEGQMLIRTASCARLPPAARAIATPVRTACPRPSWCQRIWSASHVCRPAKR
jgi:hypothetical protein